MYNVMQMNSRLVLECVATLSYDRRKTFTENSFIESVKAGIV